MTAHTDVGAYSMGLLEEQDRREFEDHLAGCPACAAELAELSPMAALFQGVELRGRGARRRGGHRPHPPPGQAAAAAQALAGGAGGGGRHRADRRGYRRGDRGWHRSTAVPRRRALALTGQVHSATDPGTGVAGTVGLVAKAWGTQVTLDLSKVRGPAECELVAVSRTGERRVVMGWLVAAPGDGVPGHPAHLVIRGGTSIPRSDLARVDVDVVNGRTLVSIPV